MKRLMLLLFAVTWIHPFTGAEKTNPASRPPHEHRVDALGDQLGTIDFAVTGSDAVRAHVTRGVKLLHHMMYIEADREFAKALAEDPQCAFAYWGRAMAIVHPLWPDTPEPAEFKQGLAYLDAARPQNPRERHYLRTMEAYFRGAPATPPLARYQAVDAAWGQAVDALPNDLDAAAFYALFHLAPARFLPKDKSHRLQLESAALIDRVLAKLPDHPGAQHYKIHAFDFPLLADRALEICDRYGAIAPDVPHALHMPTHIYTRRGQWEKSIEFNLRSAEAAGKASAATGSNSHHLHALDYLVYAYLQRGQYARAMAIRDQVARLTGPYTGANRTAMAFALAAIPARVTMEREDWAAAAALTVREPAGFPWSDDFLNCDAIAYFARAIGAARSGQPEAARRDIARLNAIRQRFAAAQPNSYWSSQASTQVLASQAWLSFAEGDRAGALTAMREAAVLEARTDKEAVTPGEVRPAGDLLGDLLLEMNEPADALAAYLAVLATSPNRLNTLAGAARAAERAGDRAQARHYHQLVQTLASGADAGCAPLQRARAFLRGSE